MGCLIQRTGSSLWNENHGETGYQVHLKSYEQFNQSYWWGVKEAMGDFPIALIGSNLHEWDNLEISSPVLIIDNLTCANLSIEYYAGETKFNGAFNISVLNDFRVEGWRSMIVRLDYPSWIEGMSRASIIVEGSANETDSLFNMVCGPGVELNLNARYVYLDSCIIQSPLTVRGEQVHVSNSKFLLPVQYLGWNQALFSRNLFLAGLIVDGNPRHCEVVNCTITNPDGAGVFLDLYRNFTLRNSIIFGCQQGIVNDHWETPVIEYCDVFGNAEGDFLDCQPGEGCLSANPRFVDPAGGDYHLRAGSPCIDAGDPESPQDPDHSRADMGAYPFDIEHAVSGEEALPSEFSISAFPNPFNHDTGLKVQLPNALGGRLDVFDLTGRLLTSTELPESIGIHHFCLSGEILGGAGVYFARARAGDRIGVVKVVYMP